jgi:ubiquinone/menaquinone biosynthesis C-methylase UbiE
MWSGFQPGLPRPSRPVPRALRRGAAALYARFAFGQAAPIYTFLTDHAAWRSSCRALGDLVPGPRVLDLGIGPGTSALEMARADLGKRHVGLDLSGAMLGQAAAAAAAAHVPLPLVQADATRLPFRAGALDGATGHSFLYLVPDPAATLAELHRTVRSGGCVAFLEPRAGRPHLGAAVRSGGRCAASMVMWRTMSRLHMRFTEAALCELLERAGFTDARAWPVLCGFGVMGVATRR